MTHSGPVKIPTPPLKPSDFFLEEDIRIPCLRGIGRNASISGLGQLERKKRKKDAQFEIFLRAKEPTKINSWQQEMLERLLEKGELVSAIEQGFEEYRKWQDPSDFELEEDFWNDVKAGHLLRHLVLSTVVIDAIQKRVLLSLLTGSEGNLDEHGICIALKKGRWRFFHRDEFTSYLSVLQSKGVERTWQQIYPQPSPKTPVETDPTYLYGTWKFDKKKAIDLAQRLSKSKDTIESVEGYSYYQMKLAPKVFELVASPMCRIQGKLLSVEKQGNQVLISWSQGGNEVKTMQLVFDNQRLMTSYGLVLKLTGAFTPDTEAVEDLSFILGKWEIDPKQTRALLQYRGVSEERIKGELKKSRHR